MKRKKIKKKKKDKKRREREKKKINNYYIYYYIGIGIGTKSYWDKKLLGQKKYFIIFILYLILYSNLIYKI